MVLSLKLTFSPHFRERHSPVFSIEITLFKTSLGKQTKILSTEIITRETCQEWKWEKQPENTSRCPLTWEIYVPVETRVRNWLVICFIRSCRENSGANMCGTRSDVALFVRSVVHVSAKTTNNWRLAVHRHSLFWFISPSPSMLADRTKWKVKVRYRFCHFLWLLSDWCLFTSSFLSSVCFICY